MTLRAFSAQVRVPRQLMPPMPPSVVSDEEIEQIYAYVRNVPPPPARLLTDLPSGELSSGECSTCHARYNPTIVRQFSASAMGRVGRQNPRVDHPSTQLSCANCHGTNHDTIMAVRGRVPESVCAGCHVTIYQEHVVDAGHSYGPGPAGIGIKTGSGTSTSPITPQMPRKVMEMGCDPCHAQAGATDEAYWSQEEKKYIDSSSLQYRNGCMACHTRHAFNLEEARKPESCYTCHMGPDHPNYEAYMSSKHGSIYAARGDAWDWTEPMASATWEAPTCAYCHTGVRGRERPAFDQSQHDAQDHLGHGSPGRRGSTHRHHADRREPGQAHGR